MLRARSILPILLLAAVTACSSAQPSTIATSGPEAGPGGPSTAASDTNAPSDQPVASDEPSPPPSAAEGPSGSEAPSATVAPDPSDTPLPAGGSAQACTGSAANRAFFVSVAGAVGWPVLCAVLPNHWFVNSGSYRLANGGKLLISYKGPGGATLALSEGSFCGAADGCVPSGTDAGDAALGPLSGTLVELDGGGFAIVVDRGANPSWLLETHGLDKATTTSIGAGLAVVGR